MNQNLAAMMTTTTKTTTNKCCPMCRRLLGFPGGLLAEKDDAGQYFVFAFCAPCSKKFKHWPPNIRTQQVRAAIGLLATNPQRYDVKLFDSKAAAWIYVELEVEAMKRGRWAA